MHKPKKPAGVRILRVAARHAREHGEKIAFLFGGDAAKVRKLMGDRRAQERLRHIDIEIRLARKRAVEAGKAHGAERARERHAFWHGVGKREERETPLRPVIDRRRACKKRILVGAEGPVRAARGALCRRSGVFGKIRRHERKLFDRYLARGNTAFFAKAARVVICAPKDGKHGVRCQNGAKKRCPVPHSTAETMLCPQRIVERIDAKAKRGKDGENIQPLGGGKREKREKFAERQLQRLRYPLGKGGHQRAVPAQQIKKRQNCRIEREERAKHAVAAKCRPHLARSP